MPPGSRKDAESALEGAAEGGFRFIARIEGNARNRVRRVGETARGELHAPLREIAHGRIADEGGKAGGEGGPRETDFGGKGFGRPGPVEPSVEERERAANRRIAQSGEPALLAFGERGHVTMHRLLEEKLGEAQSVKVIWKPNLTTAVEEDNAETIMKLISALEDDDDVQNLSLINI